MTKVVVRAVALLSATIQLTSVENGKMAGIPTHKISLEATTSPKTKLGSQKAKGKDNLTGSE